MKRTKLALVLLMMANLGLVKAQLPSSDQIATDKGALVIKPVQHASMILTWNNKTILVDPSGQADKYKTMPDLILISDIHGDHFDPKLLTALDLSKTEFVIPQAVADEFPKELMGTRVHIMKNGGNMTVAGIPISAIPMYNLPEAADSKHPKGRGNGYIITLGGKNIYFSGDTEDIPEMRSLKGIDVAFVCMNLPYTMDVNQAADGVLAFKPKVVYPYHYHGQDPQAFKKLVNEKNKQIDVRLLEWYPAQ